MLEFKRKTLVVDRMPLALQDDALSLAGSEKKEVHYDSEIPPFSSIRRGDYVSLHWNFASEIAALFFWSAFVVLRFVSGPELLSHRGLCVLAIVKATLALLFDARCVGRRPVEPR